MPLERSPLCAATCAERPGRRAGLRTFQTPRSGGDLNRWPRAVGNPPRTAAR